MKMGYVLCYNYTINYCTIFALLIKKVMLTIFGNRISQQNRDQIKIEYNLKPIQHQASIYESTEFFTLNSFRVFFHSLLEKVLISEKKI